MAESIVEKTVPIPEDVQIQLDGLKVKVTGPKGSLSEDLSHLPVNIKLTKKELLVSPRRPKKRGIAKAGTAAAHVKNMIRGVTKGFTYKLKIVYAHFPVTVKVLDREKKVLIENFIGEKTPRVIRVFGDTTVKVSGDDIIVQGTRLEDVGQTAETWKQEQRSRKRTNASF